MTSPEKSRRVEVKNDGQTVAARDERAARTGREQMNLVCPV